MWKWTCSAEHREGFGDLIWEHHSKESAQELIAAHIFRAAEKLLGNDVPVCTGVHIPVDDGEPCDYPNCRIPYIRE